MGWMIRVSFSDSELTVLALQTKPDRKFGLFTRPADAHDWLIRHSWDCGPAKEYYSSNYYRKGNMMAVIESQHSEELMMLEVLSNSVEQKV